MFDSIYFVPVSLTIILTLACALIYTLAQPAKPYTKRRIDVLKGLLIGLILSLIVFGSFE